MTGNIIVKPSVRQRFDSFMERGRVLFFSAPCGFGKSTLSGALLSGRDVLRLNAGAADFALPALSDGWDILLIDDFQMIPAEDGGQALCELIRSDPGKRFLLLSRGAPPGYLTAFQYSGLMTTLEADDLLFDREDICKYFSGCGVAVTDSEIGGSTFPCGGFCWSWRPLNGSIWKWRGWSAATPTRATGWTGS